MCVCVFVLTSQPILFLSLHVISVYYRSRSNNERIVYVNEGKTEMAPVRPEGAAFNQHGMDKKSGENNHRRCAQFNCGMQQMFRRIVSLTGDEHVRRKNRSAISPVDIRTDWNTNNGCRRAR